MPTWREITEQRKAKLEAELEALNTQLEDPNFGQNSADEDIQQGFEMLADEYGKWAARDLLDAYEWADLYRTSPT